VLTGRTSHSLSESESGRALKRVGWNSGRIPTEHSELLIRPDLSVNGRPGFNPTSRPEGRPTFKDISFRINKIVSVEGETVVRGVPKGKVIEFYTIGGKKSIRFGNGEETGLKWLADKKECLIFAKGEGFCRR